MRSVAYFSRNSVFVPDVLGASFGGSGGLMDWASMVMVVSFEESCVRCSAQKYHAAIPQSSTVKKMIRVGSLPLLCFFRIGCGVPSCSHEKVFLEWFSWRRFLIFFGASVVSPVLGIGGIVADLWSGI